MNLLHDLGATPGTLMAGLTLRPASSLDEYGVDPASSEEPPTGPDEQGWRFYDGSAATPYTLVDGQLIQLT